MKASMFPRKTKDNGLFEISAQATDLKYKSQPSGLLTALCPTPIRLNRYNYVNWLCVCHHGHQGLKALINQHKEQIALYMKPKIIQLMDGKLEGTEKIRLQRESGFRGKAVIRVDTSQDIKLLTDLLNTEAHDFLKHLLEQSGDFLKQSNILIADKKLLYPRLALVTTSAFNTQDTSSCGCLKLETPDLLVVQTKAGSTSEQVVLALTEISEASGVHAITLKGRMAQDSDLTVREMIAGNGARHTKSISKAYHKAKAVNRLINNQGVSFEEASLRARLSPEEKFVLKNRLIVQPPTTLQSLAQSEYLSCSSERVRQLETRALTKICESYGLSFN
jgi:Sigma-70, region 4